MGLNEAGCYTKESYVPASMCDGATKLSVIAIFQLVEDAVTELMGDLKIDGITAMRAYGAMWVFVKNNVRVFRRPAWREPFTIRCFVSGRSAARLLIDTALLDDAGRPLAHSRLELCALDLETGRIRKAATVGVTEDLPLGEPLPELEFTRFPQETPPVWETVRVRSTNLDYCSHTNNIEYIRFILNTYPAEELRTREIRRIEAHYARQSFEGDELRVCRDRDGDFISIRRGDESVTDCVLTWDAPCLCD